MFLAVPVAAVFKIIINDWIEAKKEKSSDSYNFTLKKRERIEKKFTYLVFQTLSLRTIFTLSVSLQKLSPM